MGFANPNQINGGIHLRLYSRAFIVDDTQRRFVFVSVDCGMVGQLIKMKVKSLRCSPSHYKNTFDVFITRK
ncbi:hypothetical protein SK128_014861 [Halocaridina rubra]|uniref:Neutral ceramidase n=1 Tax=Halocaridina rubra TaxID=373956 RepID=A0AAN8WWG7_HALRR